MKWLWVDKLIEKRLKEQKSIRTLACELEISFSNLSRIERGDGYPNNHTALILERYIFPDITLSCQCNKCKSRQDILSRLEALEHKLINTS